MQSRLTRAVVAVLLLSSWQAPAIAALGLGLHLAHGHHAPEHASAQEAQLDLALAARHGHHHEPAVAPHDHTALRAAVAGVTAPATAADCPPQLGIPAALTASARPPAAPPPTGSPPLFRTHCALLL